MAPQRILLVDGHRESANVVERALRRDLRPEVSIVRVARCPSRTEGFDAAIVLADEAGLLPARIPDLPTVVVGPGACSSGCADLVRRGVQHGLTEECAACPRQSSLVRSLTWAIERVRIVRELDRARRREHEFLLHDALTGLANVQQCRERLRRLLAQARRRSKHVAVLFLDLDRFKEVNDRLGHAAGDRLLQEVASRLRACTRETDTVARRGGDEFVVLLDDVRDPSDAGSVARQMLECLSRPCLVHGAVVRPSASIGVAVFPADGHDGETLEERADLAMYAAKKAGGNRVFLAGDPAEAELVLRAPSSSRRPVSPTAAIQSGSVTLRAPGAQEFRSRGKSLEPGARRSDRVERPARSLEVQGLSGPDCPA